MFQARVDKETAIAEELFQKVHLNNLYFKGTVRVVSSILMGLYA